MLQVLRACGENPTDYARWACSRVPLGSALRVLPLYAYAQTYAYRRDAGLVTSTMFWVEPQLQHYTDQALCGWFAESDPATWSQFDLNHGHSGR